MLEAYCAQRGLPYNLTKLELLAKSSVMVGIQGGGSHLLACFTGALLVMYHRRGWENPHAYIRGAYKYLSNSTQSLLVARTTDELRFGIAIIARIKLFG